MFENGNKQTISGNKRIILASGSPRRKELLAGLDIDFEIDTRNNFKEKYSKDTPHSQITALMSEGKSLGFHRLLEKNEILITADTMVLCGDEVLGKPKGNDEREKAADASRMLRLLSGKEHKVLTSVTIRDITSTDTFTDAATVLFKDLSDEEIQYYIRNYRPFDKAGAYGIQEWIGYIGISSIKGSFYTIMGLPVHLLFSHLQDFLKHIY